MVARTSKAEAPAWPTDVIAFGSEQERTPCSQAVGSESAGTGDAP